MLDYTTTSLIESIKRRGSIPAKQTLFDELDFCALMTDAQQIRVVPNILRVREEFFVRNSDHDIQDGPSFPVPERAIGNRVRQVQILDEQGRVLRKLSRLSPELGEEQGNDFTLVNRAGYFFRGNNIVLAQANSDALGTTLRIQYYRRPSKLVPTENAGQITNIVGTTVTVANAPATWAIGTILDGIDDQSPFDEKKDDIEVLGVAGNDLTLSADNAAALAVGDWLCDAGESVIPQYPVELHPILVQYVLVKIFDSQSDSQATALAGRHLEELERNTYEMIGDRDDGSPKKINSGMGIFDFTDPYAWDI